MQTRFMTLRIRQCLIEHGHFKCDGKEEVVDVIIQMRRLYGATEMSPVRYEAKDHAIFGISDMIENR